MSSPEEVGLFFRQRHRTRPVVSEVHLVMCAFRWFGFSVFAVCNIEAEISTNLLSSSLLMFIEIRQPKALFQQSRPPTFYRVFGGQFSGNRTWGFGVGGVW